jgi:hypothetical protein
MIRAADGSFRLGGNYLIEGLGANGLLARRAAERGAEA